MANRNVSLPANPSLRPALLSTIRLTAGAITGILLLLAERQFIPLVRFYHLAFYGIVFIGLYTLILWVIGEFTKEDWNYIWDSLHPKEMYDYIKDEIKP